MKQKAPAPASILPETSLTVGDLYLISCEHERCVGRYTGKLLRGMPLFQPVRWIEGDGGLDRLVVKGPRATVRPFGPMG